MSLTLSCSGNKRFTNTGRNISNMRAMTSYGQRKNLNLTGKNKNLKIINEKHELKAIRSSYNNFISIFTAFSVKNGPNLIKKELSASFLKFQDYFDNLLIYCNQYYDSSSKSRRIGRYSPIIEYSSSLLREWTIIISNINEFLKFDIVPHSKLIKSNYLSISKSVSKMANSQSKITFYKDAVLTEMEKIKHEISKVTFTVEKTFKNMKNEDLKIEKLNKMQKDAQFISKRVNEDFIRLFPSNISYTPENMRLRGQMKTSCGNIIMLIEAGFFFKDDLKNLFIYMKKLDNSIRELLDNMGIGYAINVTPNGENAPEKNSLPKEEKELKNSDKEMFHIQIPNTRRPVSRSLKTSSKFVATQIIPKSVKQQSYRDNQRMMNFMDEMSHTLGIKLEGDNESKIDLIEKTIKERLSGKNEGSSVRFSTPSSSIDNLSQNDE